MLFDFWKNDIFFSIPHLGSKVKFTKYCNKYFALPKFMDRFFFENSLREACELKNVPKSEKSPQFSWPPAPPPGCFGFFRIWEKFYHIVGFFLKTGSTLDLSWFLSNMYFLMILDLYEYVGRKYKVFLKNLMFLANFSWKTNVSPFS